MVNITTISEMKCLVKKWRVENLTIGLVPTMGFLHEGHLSLIRRSLEENDRTVVSIFVNPLQFGENEDLDKYPRDIDRDNMLCRELGTDVVFNPGLDQMYPVENNVYIDVKKLGDNLCGAFRKGHFRGVLTVVAKLFNIVMPDRAYFGQKDAQQLAIVEKMVEDLNFDTKIVPCPIVREKDGLAMSSRNAYLSQEERRAAPIIYKSLKSAEQLINNGEYDTTRIREKISADILKEKKAEINYVEIVDRSTLSRVDKIDSDVLVAAAVYFGKTRLIDNFIWYKDKGKSYDSGN